jgi:hypothetical protein
MMLRSYARPHCRGDSSFAGSDDKYLPVGPVCPPLEDTVGVFAGSNDKDLNADIGNRNSSSTCLRSL